MALSTSSDACDRRGGGGIGTSDPLRVSSFNSIYDEDDEDDGMKKMMMDDDDDDDDDVCRVLVCVCRVFVFACGL
jgi:hypothetical protein